MKLIRRVNLYAGPGAGKSTTAAYLFNYFKRQDTKVELVQEYAKELAYKKRSIGPWKQLEIFMAQAKRELIPLEGGADFIITDSPLPLINIYARRYGCKGQKAIGLLCEEFEEEFPSINFFLDRGEKEYLSFGRNETRKEAQEIDNEVKEYLKHTSSPFIVPFHKPEEIISVLESWYLV